MGVAVSQPLPPVATTRLAARRAQTRALATRFGGSAPLLVVAVSLLMQLGSALAALLFVQAGVLGTLWLRTAFAAAVLLVAFRGRLRFPTAGERVPLLLFAVVLAAMNVCYFEAIDRAPLGLVSTVEFLGPLAVAVAGTRGLRELGFVGLAGVGVLLLGTPGGNIGGAGLVLALGSAACWAAYLVLGRRLVLSLDPASTLALSSVLAAILLLPAGVASGGAALHAPNVLLLCLGVAMVGNVAAVPARAAGTVGWCPRRPTASCSAWSLRSRRSSAWRCSARGCRRWTSWRSAAWSPPRRARAG